MSLVWQSVSKMGNPFHCAQIRRNRPTTPRGRGKPLPYGGMGSVIYCGEGLLLRRIGKCDPTLFLTGYRKNCHCEPVTDVTGVAIRIQMGNPFHCAQIRRNRPTTPRGTGKPVPYGSVVSYPIDRWSGGNGADGMDESVPYGSAVQFPLIRGGGYFRRKASKNSCDNLRQGI